MSESENLPTHSPGDSVADSDTSAVHRQSARASSQPAGSQPAGSQPDRLSGRSPRERFEQLLAARRDGRREHEPEETLWSGNYSSRAAVGWWISAIAITLGLILASFVFPQFSIAMALGIAIILWLLIVANFLRMSMGFHYELTSQRLIHKTGLVTRQSDRIEVIDIDDVSYQQGPVQRLFGVGTITITSSDRSHPELKLLGIAQVSEVAGLIDDVRRAERRRRALHIEAI